MVATEQAQTLGFHIVRQVKTQPPLTFTVQITYAPDGNGYLAECFELEVVTWGNTWEEAAENLVDAIWGVAKVSERPCDRPEFKRPMHSSCPIYCFVRRWRIGP